MSKPVSFVSFAIFSIFLAAGCKTLTGETAGHHLDDTTITAAIKAKLVTQDRIGSLTRIGVKTVENTVYLSGKVTTPQEKNQVEEIARRTDGVKNVVNDIEVQPE